MQSFAIEVYLPRSGAELRSSIARLREAAQALTREGRRVAYRHSLFLPSEETCFHVLDGISREAVSEAARRAAIDAAQITEAAQ